MAVKDNFNHYLTQLQNGLQNTYPKIKSGTVYKATPPSYPYFYMKQIDGSTALTTLSNTEDGINMGLEIQFYSKTSQADVRAIALEAKEIMRKCGFNCTYFQGIDNIGDTSVYRWATRFEQLEV